MSITAVLAVGGVASAHIDPDPPAVAAGSTATVGFKIEHGCDGSPTTDLKFEIPDGVTDVAAMGKEGWTATLTGNVLEFKGGPLAADTEDHFDITFTAPAQAGDIHFPIIQTCAQGELAWIEIAAEGAAEPEHPAPTLKVTDGPPTSADLVPEAEGTDAPAAIGTLRYQRGCDPSAGNRRTRDRERLQQHRHDRGDRGGGRRGVDRWRRRARPPQRHDELTGALGHTTHIGIDALAWRPFDADTI